MENNKKRKLKVCHMTSAHKSDDTRIFHKECVSLANNGYDVFLVSHGDSYTKNGVRVVGLGEKPTNRLKRMLSSAKNVYKKAKELDADIYHIHDPELLPYAYRLKKEGKKVIFDSHEDYLSTITEKAWIPSFFRRFVSKTFKMYEKRVIGAIDAAIVCYHWTEDRYGEINDNVKMILNFPILEDENAAVEKRNLRKISFAGGVTRQWCHKEIIEAIGRLGDVEYELAGRLSGSYGEELRSLEGWKLVNYHGVLPHQEVKGTIYANSSIGMALLDYIAQCKGTIGNLSNTKFFEYMQMGLPLVCTDFQLWKEIIEEEECGICVNPHNIDEIADAIKYLLDNPSIAEQMGRNGQKAVIYKYNWGMEEKKLLSLYQTISN